MATYDLTTRDRVKTLGGISLTDTSRDSEIDFLITAASREIIRYARREFAVLQSGLSRTFPVTDPDYVSLYPSELRAPITSVTANTEGAAPTILTADQYQLLPVGGADGVYGALRLLSGAYVRPVVPLAGSVTIIASWGWASVPEDVELLCVQTVITWLRRGDEIPAASFGGDTGGFTPATVPLVGVLPYTIQRALDVFRIPVVA